MAVRTFGAIDVGSFELILKIYEFSGKDHIREIDCIRRNVDLGSDTYAKGKIGSEKMDELCRTLHEFSEILKSYRVEAYKAYGTSAIREAQNSITILDQIKQRTGITIEVLSNSEQRFLGYKSVASKGEEFRRIIEQKTAVVEIGGGSIQLSLFDNDTLVSTQNLRLGVLRIQEQLHSLRAGNARLEEWIDELAMAQLSTYKKLYLKDREINNIIVIDDYVSPWMIHRAGGNPDRTVIGAEEFRSMVSSVRSTSARQNAAQMGVSEEKGALVFISAVLVGRIAQLMGAESIWVPGVTLCDGIAYEYAEKIKMFRGEHDFERDIVACAKGISKRYMGSRKRAETLERIATTIFDSMKKVHGLGRRERLYLTLAAILHDCGKYISLVNIGETSYNIIMATEIIGLSHAEREMVANIVRFYHSKFVYYGQEGSSEIWADRETYLTVSKLTAILRLASSLDRSHKEKMKGLKAGMKDDELVLVADTMEDITLENRAFESAAEFFAEVFSLQPVLKQKKSF